MIPSKSPIKYVTLYIPFEPRSRIHKTKPLSQFLSVSHMYYSSHSTILKTLFDKTKGYYILLSYSLCIQVKLQSSFSIKCNHTITNLIVALPFSFLTPLFHPNESCLSDCLLPASPPCQKYPSNRQEELDKGQAKQIGFELYSGYLFAEPV